MRALLVLALLALPSALAYPDPDAAPRYFESACHQSYDKRFVHDFVGLFTDGYGRELEGAACEIHAKTSAHFVIAAVADTEGEILENYALHLFEAWGIGDDERHDGLLILYVDDHLSSGEAALRIEVGYGLEGVVSSRVTEDAWDLMIEQRDRALELGETPRGARAFAIAAGSLYLLGVLEDGYTEAGFPEPRPVGAAPWWFWALVIILVLLLIWLIASSSRGERGWSYRSRPDAWRGGSTGIWLPPGGGDRGWSGGGGSFGGGRSGGGGRGGKF